MTYDPTKHQRRSIRLPGYDYSQAGAYFVTVCTQDHQCLFGRIEGEVMRPNRVGEIAEQCWQAIHVHFAKVQLDASVVMPNHVHGIIVIADVDAPNVRATHASPLRQGADMAVGVAAVPQGPKRRSVGAIIGSYKSAVSKGIHEIGGALGPAIWQRNYYEHIIRNDLSLNRIRQYILDNPARWAYDRYNPRAICPEADDPWQE
jgi:putative transposase